MSREDINSRPHASARTRDPRACFHFFIFPANVIPPSVPKGFTVHPKMIVPNSRPSSPTLQEKIVPFSFVRVIKLSLFYSYLQSSKSSLYNPG